MVDLERFGIGDGSYFAELVRACGPMVIAVTRSFARDSDHAEDLFQDVWVQVYQKRHLYAGRGSFEAWLHRIATNVCLTDYRAIKARSRGLDRLMRGGDDDRVGQVIDSLERAEQEEFQQRLHRALAHLSIREHEALLLRVLENRSPTEVADIMGVEKSTVRSLLRHAVKRLRDIMENPDDELSRRQSTH